jgi:hypothetical protein
MAVRRKLVLPPFSGSVIKEHPGEGVIERHFMKLYKTNNLHAAMASGHTVEDNSLWGWNKHHGSDLSSG